MDNSTTYDIRLNIIGGNEVTKLPAKIEKIGEVGKSISSSLTPLAKIIQLLENTNKILLEIGKVSVHTFNKLDDVADISAQGFKKTEKAVTDLGNKIEGLKNKANGAGAEIKKSLYDKIGELGQKFIGIKSIVSSAASAIAPIFEAGMARETAAVNFDTLLDKETEEKGVTGKVYADYLRNTDAAALYGTDTVNQNAQAMLAYGVDPKTTVDVLKSIGDIAMGDANKMSSLATAFSQMNSLGKLQSQDWKQMVGAGFNPFIQMQKDLGKTAEELDAMMSKGEITADMVKDAFINSTKGAGQFAGALENVMEGTLQGKIAQFQGLWDDLKAKIFDLIKPLADKLLPVAGKLIEKLDCFAPVIEGLMAILGPVMDWIGENIEELMTLATAIGVVAGVIALCTSPVTGIVLAIMGLIYVLVNVIKKWNEWKETITLIFPPLSWIIELIMSVKKHWNSIVDGFRSGGILEGIKRIGLTIADALLAPIETLLELIAKIPGMEKLANWIGGGVSNLREKINGMLPEPEKKENGTQSTDVMDQLNAAVNGNTGGGSSADLANATGKGKESVASGGTRNTQITINLGNMVENVNFQGGVDDNKDSLTSQLEECLLRVLYSATSAV